MGSALMRCLRHSGPYRWGVTPPGGRDTGHNTAMSEAGWVNLYDLMPYRWAGELFNGPSELVSTLVLPSGREKIRAL